MHVLQSLALANLFVWMEMLFFFGYRRDLHSTLQVRIAAERAKSNVSASHTAPLLDDQHKAVNGS